MIEIRPIWNSREFKFSDDEPEISELLSVENRVLQAWDVFIGFSKNLFDEDYVYELEFLMKSAKHDLEPISLG